MDLFTSRLRLRSFQSSDINGLYLDWLNDPEVTRFSNQRFRQHTVESCKAYLAGFEDTANSFLLIQQQQDQQPIGTIIEVPTMRRFAGIELISDRIPDEITILTFRHLLEQHTLGEQIFEIVKAHLSARGMTMRQGTIVDATLMAAPSSTKNKQGNRDSEMHQTKKGNQWYFGMKIHIGVDKDSGLIHSVATTAANVHDLTPGGELLHGDEEVVYGDAGYQGIAKRREMADTTADFRVALRPGKRHALPNTPDGHLLDLIETAKAHISSKVEHPFRVIKQQFGFQKTRLRGLAKNRCKINVLAALTNLFMARRQLLATA